MGTLTFRDCAAWMKRVRAYWGATCDAFEPAGRPGSATHERPQNAAHHAADAAARAAGAAAAAATRCCRGRSDQQWRAPTRAAAS
jgi:hypothetical protein